MRSTRVAEWILSQVTSRPRAAAVIGDLLEKIPSRGVLWFWRSVATTAVALVWRDVAANPMRTFGLGLTGFVLVLALFFLLVLFALVAFAAVIGLATRTGLVDQQRLAGVAQLVGHGWLRPALSLASWCVLAMAQFQVGRWLARRSPDHELAPCVAFTLVGLTVSLALALASPQPALQAIRDSMSAALFVVLDLPLYAGAVSVRRKRLVSS
jgi:hypothetical protein